MPTGEGAARRRALRGPAEAQDLLTQLAVSIQAPYLAIDLVRKNNLELIKASTARRRPTVSPCGPR